MFSYKHKNIVQSNTPFFLAVSTTALAICLVILNMCFVALGHQQSGTMRNEKQKASGEEIFFSLWTHFGSEPEDVFLTVSRTHHFSFPLMTYCREV